MATSGTDTLTAHRDLIIRRALRMIGAFPSTDNPRPEQMTDAISVLNIMLKAWSVEGFLWLRQFVTLYLVAGQNSYTLGPGDTSTTSPATIDRPQHIFSANRKSVTNQELPMVSLTRQDYMAIPNKSSQGSPVQYYYDPQTTLGVLYIWPTPSAGTTDSIILDVDRQLDIMTSDLNDYDLPPAWLETIAYCLADRLAPEYGVPLSERAYLRKEAETRLMQFSTDDRDIASIHFGVNRVR